jgi:hypothetical protein
MVGSSVRFGRALEAYTLTVQKEEEEEALKIGFLITLLEVFYLS